MLAKTVGQWITPWLIHRIRQQAGSYSSNIQSSVRWTSNVMRSVRRCIPEQSGERSAQNCNGGLVENEYMAIFGQYFQ